jgi:hypothetical protein
VSVERLLGCPDLKGTFQYTAVIGDSGRWIFALLLESAHVGETSIFTRAALTVAAHAGNALVAQEGAFGTKLLRRDLASPVLMFGRRAELDIARVLDPAAAGTGLRIDESALADRELLVG